MRSDWESLLHLLVRRVQWEGRRYQGSHQPKNYTRHNCPIRRHLSSGQFSLSVWVLLDLEPRGAPPDPLLEATRTPPPDPGSSYLAATESSAQKQLRIAEFNKRYPAQSTKRA